VVGGTLTGAGEIFINCNMGLGIYTDERACAFLCDVGLRRRRREKMGLDWWDCGLVWRRAVLRKVVHEQVSVLEMDGSFDKLEELIYVESHLSNTSSKFYGEITQQMLKNSTFPGSTNGTGLFQTIVGLKIREVYESITQKKVVPAN
jgi:hypothetical protein